MTLPDYSEPRDHAARSYQRTLLRQIRPNEILDASRIQALLDSQYKKNEGKWERFANICGALTMQGLKAMSGTGSLSCPRHLEEAGPNERSIQTGFRVMTAIAQQATLAYAEHQHEREEVADLEGLYGVLRRTYRPVLARFAQMDAHRNKEYETWLGIHSIGNRTKGSTLDLYPSVTGALRVRPKQQYLLEADMAASGFEPLPEAERELAVCDALSAGILPKLWIKVADFVVANPNYCQDMMDKVYKDRATAVQVTVS